MARTLTDREKRILRAFQRQVDRLRGSTLNPSGAVTIKTTTQISMTTGTVETHSEGYDRTAFQAQLPILRQFLLQNDDVNFINIKKLIVKCCDRPELVSWTELTHRMWKTVLRSPPNDSYCHFHGATLPAEDAAKKLFYGSGGLFHIGIDEPLEEESDREIHESTLQAAFPELWQCLHNLDAMILLWLDEPSRPVPPLPIE